MSKTPKNKIKQALIKTVSPLNIEQIAAETGLHWNTVNAHLFKMLLEDLEQKEPTIFEKLEIQVIRTPKTFLFIIKTGGKQS